MVTPPGLEAGGGPVAARQVAGEWIGFDPAGWKPEKSHGPGSILQKCRAITVEEAPMSQSEMGRRSFLKTVGLGCAAAAFAEQRLAAQGNSAQAEGRLAVKQVSPWCSIVSWNPLPCLCSMAGTTSSGGIRSLC